jgi:hypothetical protein
MALAHSPSIVMNGLILCLDAGNTKSYPLSGGIIWYDLSGNNRNGELKNTPTITSGIDKSLSFDGINEYVDFGYQSAMNFGTGNFTVFFWMYPTAWGDRASRGVVDFKFNDSTTGWTIYNDGYNADPTGNSKRMNARIGGSNAFFTDTDVVVNTWQCWAVSRNSTTLSWYYNGSVNKTTTGVTVVNINETLQSVSPDSPFLAVGRSNTWGGHFQGRIPMCLIYNSALSAAEVRQNFNATRGRYGI